MPHIKPGTHCSAIDELDELLIEWMQNTNERTISADTDCRKGYITVVIDDIGCVIAGDTRRDGVEAYLRSRKQREKLVVELDSSRIPRRVAFGRIPERIQGFYLYTAEPHYRQRELLNPMGAPIRILQAVELLHRRGYQQVRILPGVSPSGMYWRASIARASDFDTDGNLVESSMTLHYTTGAASELAGQRVTTATSAATVAQMIDRALCLADDRRRDWSYAGWYAELMEAVACHDGLPVAYADGFDASRGWEVGWGSDVWHPRPPVGSA